MKLPDVNVLVNAYSTSARVHRQHKQWLDGLLEAGEPLAISELSLSAVIRITTHPGVDVDGSGVRRFVRELMSYSRVQPINPGRGHFEIFMSLCQLPGVVGNVVPDAYYAAMAIERDLEFVTADRGFARFPGLRWTLLA